jgi:hypothetical protein
LEETDFFNIQQNRKKICWEKTDFFKYSTEQKKDKDYDGRTKKVYQKSAEEYKSMDFLL